MKLYFSYNDLLDVVTNLNKSQIVKDLIIYERLGNYEASRETNNVHGYLKNRTRYIRVYNILKYEHTNIAFSVDHIEQLILGTVAEVLFGRSHEKLKKLGHDEIGSWNYNRDPADINQPDFKYTGNNDNEYTVEFKYQSPECLLTRLNNDRSGKFWKLYCHKADIICCWHDDTEYRLANNGSKWVIWETKPIDISNLSTLRITKLKLAYLDPDIIYNLDPDYFNNIKDMSEDERKKLEETTE